MADEFDFPILTDPDVMFNEWVAEVRTYFPQFNPSPNSLAYATARALCNMIATGTDVAAVVPPSIFRTVGSSLFEISPLAALPATADTTWNAVDDAGYDTIPAGTVVSISGILFETTEDVAFPSGTTTVTPIGISALDEGIDANDLGSPGGVVILEEGYEYVDTVTQVATTIGGQDGETTEAFTVRLRRTLRVLYPFVAVNGTDLERIARTIPAVYRALSLDNYDYPSSTPNVAGVATVLLQGFDGLPVSSPIKDQYTALIQPDPRRLVNNVLYVEDPTYVTVNSHFEFTVHTGAEPSIVLPAAIAAVRDLLDPIKWGLPQSGEEPLWTNKPIVSVYDIAGRLDGVEGLDRVTLIEVGLNADPPTAGDKTMAGIAPLPQPGVVTGTVV